MGETWMHGLADALPGLALFTLALAAVALAAGRWLRQTEQHRPVAEDPPSTADRLMHLEREVSALRFEWQAAAEHLTSLGEAAETRRKRAAASASRTEQQQQQLVEAAQQPLSREDEIAAARARHRAMRGGM